MISMQLKDYQKYFDDITDKADFDRLYLRAEGLLRGLTTRRIDTVVDPSDFRYEQVEMTIAYVIHHLHAKPSSSGIKIVSNDGYSEHYDSEQSWNESVENTVRSMLSGTGLMGFM